MAEIIESTVSGKYLMFRGKPLLREGNQICYGDMEDDYMMYLLILSNKTIQMGDKKVEVPDRIIVQILKNDPSILGYERIVKQFDKNNLYDAFQAGLIQLDRLRNVHGK
ncbi:MAG: hypothetical protein E7616_01115 [Ruminococcaceae bacterium]|nr:hypothetical protein [Oscillospiraceae bacterium]